MGWFGPDPEQVSVGGKIHYQMVCKRGKCKNRIFKNEDKKKCKNEWSSHQRDHDIKAKKGASKIKDLRDKRRAKKGKCPTCHKDPCRMDNQKCIQSAIGEWGSSSDLDMSDPATFNDQLKWYKDNM
jgi:hypothetical protein